MCRSTVRLRLLTLLLSGPMLFACAPSESVENVELGPMAGLEEELESLVPTLLDAFAVPGAAVGVIHDGEVHLQRGFGLADVASGQPVDAGVAFNIGSISKTVAAWGVMKLVESGDLELDAPVSTYLTRWQLPDSEFDHDDVTVRRALSHTAGLSLSGYPGFQPGEPLPTVEESLSGATNGPGAVFVAHEPGSRWQYSGGGYTLTQLIVEEITGQPFAEYMKAEVLEPLGMNSSSYVWDDDIERIAATPYGGGGEPIGGPRFTAMAAAGLQTTLEDFARFALASMGRLDGEDGTAGVLSRESLGLMQSPVDPADDYGLGYSYEVTGGVTLVGHGGANEGWMAYLTIAPASGDGLVVMTNGSNGGRVHGAINCVWQRMVTGETCDPPVTIPVQVDEETLRALEGAYAIPDGPTIEFRLTDGRMGVFLPNGEGSAVLASGPEEFFLVRAPIRFSLERAEDGTVTALLLLQGDEEGRAPRVESP